MSVQYFDIVFLSANSIFYPLLYLAELPSVLQVTRVLVFLCEPFKNIPETSHERHVIK